MEYKMPGEIVVAYKPAKRFGSTRQVYDPRGISVCLSASMGMGGGYVPLVLVTQKSTNTQSKYMKNNSKEYPIMAISQKSKQKNYQTSTVSLADFLARHFLSQGSEKDLKIQEGLSSLTLREYCEQNNLDYSSLKTLKDFSVTMVDELSKPSSKRLMNLGMTANGKCLTAKISASPKTGSASTLSDILEEHLDPKYFLSAEQTAKILKSWGQSQNRSGLDGASNSEEYTQ